MNFHCLSIATTIFEEIFQVSFQMLTILPTFWHMHLLYLSLKLFYIFSFHCRFHCCLFKEIFYLLSFLWTHLIQICVLSFVPVPTCWWNSINSFVIRRNYLFFVRWYLSWFRFFVFAFFCLSLSQIFFFSHFWSYRDIFKSGQIHCHIQIFALSMVLSKFNQWISHSQFGKFSSLFFWFT